MYVCIYVCMYACMQTAALNKPTFVSYSINKPTTRSMKQLYDGITTTEGMDRISSPTSSRPEAVSSPPQSEWAECVCQQSNSRYNLAPPSPLPGCAYNLAAALTLAFSTTEAPNSTPPSRRLDRFAADKHLFRELLQRHLSADEDIGFFDVLSAAPVGKSLLLQFDGQTSVGKFLTAMLFPQEDAGEPADLAMSLGAPASRLVQAAFSEALQDPSTPPLPLSVQYERVPPAGAQLYVTCDQSQTHLAYGAPAKAKTARNTAPVAKTLKDEELAAANRKRGDDEGPISLCQALFAAFLVGAQSAIAPDARMGVGEGFAQKFGRSHGDEL